MIGIDTNILLYARLEGNPFHDRAKEFLEGQADNPDVVIAELVLVEFYLALRNPAIIDSPLSAKAASQECQIFRRHPQLSCSPINYALELISAQSTGH